MTEPVSMIFLPCSHLSKCLDIFEFYLFLFLQQLCTKICEYWFVFLKSLYTKHFVNYLWQSATWLQQTETENYQWVLLYYLKLPVEELFRSIGQVT